MQQFACRHAETVIQIPKCTWSRLLNPRTEIILCVFRPPPRLTLGVIPRFGGLMLGGGGSAVGGLEHGHIQAHIGLISIQGLRRLCGRSREALESRFLDAKVADRVGSVPAPAGGVRV